MDTEHAREFEEHGIQAFRIERGAEVIGPDGSLGTVEQIVVDGASGELQSLVVRGEGGMFMELPAARIDSATGEQVYLSIGRADLAAHPELARPFKPDQYIPVDQGAVVPPGEVVNRDPDVPLLTEMEEDAIEIAAPASDLEEEDAELSGTSADAMDIADQPTIILGPDETASAGGPVQSPPTPDSGGMVASGMAVPASDLNTTGSTAGMAGMDSMDSTNPEPSDVQPGMGALADIPPEPILPEDAEVETVTEMEVIELPASEASGTSPRVPEAAAYGNLPERGPGVYITAGILATTALASVAYLLWSRRQRTRTVSLPSLGAARAQMESARASAATLAPRARDMSDRAQSRAQDLWDRVSGRAGDLGAAMGGLAALGDLARRRTQSAASNLPSAGDVRDSLTSRLPTVDTGSLRGRLSDTSNRVQDWLDDTSDAIRDRLPDLSRWTRLGTTTGRMRLAMPLLRWRPTRRAAVKVGGKVAAASAKHKVNETRRAAQRGMRRVGRRVRWFRRGMLAGALWGILYAPVPGREVRARVADYLSRVPYLRDYIVSPSQAIGSTGPHPRSDLASSHAPYPGAATGTGTPLLEPESEEPLLPTPEGDLGSVPGGTPTI